MRICQQKFFSLPVARACLTSMTWVTFSRAACGEQSSTCPVTWWVLTSSRLGPCPHMTETSGRAAKPHNKPEAGLHLSTGRCAKPVLYSQHVCTDRHKQIADRANSWSLNTMGSTVLGPTPQVRTNFCGRSILYCKAHGPALKSCILLYSHGHGAPPVPGV